MFYNVYDLLNLKNFNAVKGLRWLQQWGSPLTIPNREVKPISADGTAEMWESMSPPFFKTLIIINDKGFFMLYNQPKT